MDLLIAACLGFLITHLGISATPLRGVLVNKLGTNAYIGLYSVLALAMFGFLIYAYSQTPHTNFVWYPSAEIYKVTKVVVFLAFIMVATGAITPNPTAVMSESALDNQVAGIMKITRHPLQWGIFLFSVAHLAANGDQASIWLFSTLAILSFVGMLNMDARRRAETDEKWQSFLSQTSMLPFGAMISGKQKFTMADINWIGLGAGVGLYALIYWFHSWVSGGVSLV